MSEPRSFSAWPEGHELLCAYGEVNLMIIVARIPRAWTKRFMPALGRYCRQLTGRPWFQKWEGGNYGMKLANRYLISGIENQTDVAARLFERTRNRTASAECLALFQWCFYDEEKGEVVPIVFPE